jgi:hypothetical protein
MKPQRLAAGAVLALTAVCGAARASTTFYDNSAAFFAAITTSPLTEDFESYPLGLNVPDGGQLPGGPELSTVAYAFNSADLGRIGDTYAHFGAQSLESSSGQFSAGDSITISTASDPEYHLHFFGVFVSALPLAANSIFLDAFGGSFETGSGGYDTGAFYFIGATTDEHVFQTVTFGMHSDGSSFNVDNLTINHNPLPEPAAWTLLLVGVGGLGAALRKRLAGDQAGASKGAAA